MAENAEATAPTELGSTSVWAILLAASLLEMVAVARVIDLQGEDRKHNPYTAEEDWTLFVAVFSAFVAVVCLVLRQAKPELRAPVAIAAAGLAYLGVLRASISHQGKRRLAAQTAALALPAALLGRVCGWQLRGFGG